MTAKRTAPVVWTDEDADAWGWRLALFTLRYPFRYVEDMDGVWRQVLTDSMLADRRDADLMLRLGSTWGREWLTQEPRTAHAAWAFDRLASSELECEAEGAYSE